MDDKKFTWIQTHKDINNYLSNQENKQKELIDLLKSVGITGFTDQDKNGNKIELDEIDPYTFYCYIYKYGVERRLEYLQKIADKINAHKPTDEWGIPSAQAQKVWLFPYKARRVNNEIKRLWSFFKKELSDQINDKDFEDTINIRSVGKSKLTEALFYVNPEKYLPIDGPTKLYLKEELGINSEFNTYTEYLKLLEEVRSKTSEPFYEISYKAWEWKSSRKQVNYWIFQGNPKIFDVENALNENAIKSWKVNAHVKKINPGDKIILWVTGKSPGCYALGEVESEVFKGKNEEDQLKYYAEGIKNKSENRVSVNITHNLVENPILKDQINKNKALSKLKGGSQGTNFTTTEKEYNTLLKIAENMTEKKDEIKSNNIEFSLPLNLILYGPPGTGKTYETIIRAAEIIEERKMNNYEEALKIFKENLHERIEFITFHQNYSYEDFIQGLRPDTENDSELTFNKRDGIFKKLADKAHENLVESKKDPEDVNKRIAFEEALEKLKDQVIEADKPLKINETAFFTAVEDDAFRYTGENWTLHNKGFNGFRMKYSDLIKFNDSNIQSRKDIKELNNISGLAKQHASYFFKVYEIVKGLIPENQSTKSNIVKKNFVMIIDEINRANISRVFGELITLIEEDKRSHGKIPMEAKLPSGDIFIVPSNLYIIGTMNTADKSIALLDIALRRRFEFEPMYPKYNIEGYQIYDLEILKSLNEQIIKLKGHDFQIGHSYFMNENKDLVERMNKKVIPLLQEYFMNDIKEVKEILKKAGLNIDEDSFPVRITGKS